MKKNLNILVIVVLVFIFSPSAFIYGSDELGNAPGFRLQDVNQDMISLSDYSDKGPVVLMFWTTWSPMCPSELKTLNNAYAGLVKDGIEVLAINSGELPDAVYDFIKSYFLAYRILLDKDTTVTNLFRVQGFPTYVLINKDGKIVFRDNYFPYKDYKELFSPKDNDAG